MTTAAERPSLAPKVTRGTEDKRAAALDYGLAVDLPTDEGIERYEVRLGDLTAPLTRELRAHFGGPFEALIAEMTLSPGIDSFATFVWLARRVRGEEVAHDDVAVSYAQMYGEGFDVITTEAEELNGSPEA